MIARFLLDEIPSEEGESLVTWEVGEPAGGAVLSLIHDRIPPRTLMAVRNGWPGILEELHRMLVPGGEPRAASA